MKLIGVIFGTRGHAPRRPQRAAFTLIELLVVIAIIALLVSILVPSLKRARELAREAVCVSNLRQLGNAYYLYAEENTGHVPLWYTNPGNVGPDFWWVEWYKLYHPYIAANVMFPAEPDNSLRNRSPNWLGKTLSIFDCPSTTENVWFHWGSSPVYGNHPKTFDYLVNNLPQISTRTRSEGNYRLEDLDREGFLLIESYELDGFHSDNGADEALFGTLKRMNCTFLKGPTVSLKFNGRRSPGIHHRLGCNLLYPGGHVRWAAAEEYLVDFQTPFLPGDVFTVNYIVP